MVGVFPYLAPRLQNVHQAPQPPMDTHQAATFGHMAAQAMPLRTAHHNIDRQSRRHCRERKDRHCDEPLLPRKALVGNRRQEQPQHLHHFGSAARHHRHLCRHRRTRKLETKAPCLGTQHRQEAPISRLVHTKAAPSRCQKRPRRPHTPPAQRENPTAPMLTCKRLTTRSTSWRCTFSPPV